METDFGRGVTGNERTGSGSLGGKASQVTDNMRSKAIEGFDGGKDRVSAMLEKVARSIEDEKPIGGWAASLVRKGQRYLDERSADDLLTTARGALRERPALLIAGVFLGGFALSRLLRD